MCLAGKSVPARAARLGYCIDLNLTRRAEVFGSRENTTLTSLAKPSTIAKEPDMCAVSSSDGKQILTDFGFIGLVIED
jgi:hypothetical protein